MGDKVQIKISDILRMLKEGYTRKALAEHYGITQTAMKDIFQHPELKGKRTMPKKEETYVLVNDLSDASVDGGTDAEIPFPGTSDEPQSQEDSSEPVNSEDVEAADEAYQAAEEENLDAAWG